MTEDDPKYQTGEPPTADDIPQKDIIISPDTRRENRIPPGQSRTRKWPVLHYGTVPKINLEHWKLEIDGLVENKLTFTLSEFQELPRVKVFSDFHCVTRWSRLGNLWEGVSVNEIYLGAPNRCPVQTLLSLKVYDSGWTTNLPFSDFAVRGMLCWLICTMGNRLMPTMVGQSDWSSRSSTPGKAPSGSARSHL